MPAIITLQEPWATAIVLGYKEIETRSRNTNYRGTICIHASKKPTNKEVIEEMARLCRQWPFNLFAEDYHALTTFGKIIGQCDIVSTGRTEWIAKHHAQANICKDWSIEKMLGDYTAGRYGFVLQRAAKWNEFIPASGMQMIPWQFHGACPELKRRT